LAPSFFPWNSHSKEAERPPLSL